MDQHRRVLMRALAAAGAVGLCGRFASTAVAEPPPETTRIRLPKVPSACLAPQYVAEALLRAEGFDQIEYVGAGMQGGGVPGTQRMGAGEVDIGMNFAAPLVVAIDMGAPIVGARRRAHGLLRAVRQRECAHDQGPQGQDGRDPGPRIRRSTCSSPASRPRWASTRTGTSAGSTMPPAEGKRLLAEGGVDAYLGFPPDPQELRAKKVGRLLLNSAVDRPWSQYFCCMIVANREWADRHPVAARRAVRAILKGSELCAADPELGAKAFLAQGFNFDPELCPAGAARIAVRQVARLQPGGDAALLRAALARGRNGQELTAEDHRRRQRLAHRRPLRKEMKS